MPSCVVVMDAVSELPPWIAEKTNTTAANVSTTAIAISRADRRARSAKGPDWNLRIIIIIILTICVSERDTARVPNAARQIGTARDSNLGQVEIIGSVRAKPPDRTARHPSFKAPA